MPKPSTPSVWASAKTFGFQPSAAQQAQGFDYIATIRPGTGAPITDDHDWPFNQVTTALKWVMDQIPDSGIKSAAFRDVGNGESQIPDMSSWLSGNNGNGKYYRLPSGMQVCRFTMAIPSGQNATWTYPLAFESLPQVLHSVINPGGEAVKALWTSSSSLTQCNIFNPNSVGVNVCVTAIL